MRDKFSLLLSASITLSGCFSNVHKKQIQTKQIEEIKQSPKVIDNQINTQQSLISKQLKEIIDNMIVSTKTSSIVVDHLDFITNSTDLNYSFQSSTSLAKSFSSGKQYINEKSKFLGEIMDLTYQTSRYRFNTLQSTEESLYSVTLSILVAAEYLDYITNYSLTYLQDAHSVVEDPTKFQIEYAEFLANKFQLNVNREFLAFLIFVKYSNDSQFDINCNNFYINEEVVGPVILFLIQAHVPFSVFNSNERPGVLPSTCKNKTTVVHYNY